MPELTKQDQAQAGRTVYEMWRPFADRNACPTYSFDGMSDSFRLSWVAFALYLTNSNKKSLLSRIRG